MKLLMRSKKTVSIFWCHWLCRLKADHLQVELSILNLLGWASSRGIKATNLMAAQGIHYQLDGERAPTGGACETHAGDS
jgi:hypothetical protein